MTQALAPDARIDITAEVCPMTYVRAKLRLETLPPGGVLEIVLQGEEPLKNLPRNFRAEGHEPMPPEPLGEGRFRLCVRKGQGAGQ
jgi:TusA-related sulfurtransferase